MNTNRPLMLKSFQGPTPPREVIVLDQSHDVLPLDRISCTDLCAVAKAWMAMPRRQGERLPRWTCFRPEKFVFCLDKFCILKAKDWRNNQIEFSLYGGHPTDFLGNGKPLVMQELRRDPERSANYIDIRDRAGRAIDNEAPQYVRKTLSWNNDNYIEYETLMLPFAAEGGSQRIMQPVSARARLRLVQPSTTTKWCEINKR